MDKIICVGKNYLEHAKELGDAVPARPVLFLKPPSTLVWLHPSQTTDRKPLLPLPEGRGEVHHECEIVVRIKRGGSHLNVEQASQAIDAVTLGLDMTLRDVQSQLKKAGHPWEVSKVFEAAAVVGPWISLDEFRDYLETPFRFSLDGKVRQSGRGQEMSLKPAECIAYASENFPLCEGDILFTGTPAGVGPVRPGQTGELRWGERLRLELGWTASRGSARA